MGKTSNRPSVINMDLNFARLIIRSYDENNETYLRNLVRKHVPNAERVLSCADRSNLLYHTRTIRGVARKINRHDLQISEQNQDILEKINSLSNITDGAEREAVDERICLQLEGRNIPEESSVSNAYTSAKYAMSLR
jgi:hypothetical protein